MNKKQKTVSFYTIGCRLNKAETAVMEQSLKEHGYRVTGIKNPADIVVVNTCTVTENGDADTRRIINRIQKINKNAQIALVGCQAQTQGKELMTIPGVQWVIGNQLKMDLPEILQNNPTEPQLMTPEIKPDNFTIPVAGIDTRHTRANLKIQDGCNFFCSYCEIPYARGRARSRVFDDIFKEAEILINAGHKELILTGINIGTYNYNDYNISDVISKLTQFKGLERIRISSIEAKTIPDNLLDMMTPFNKLCRYLHISMQSGSNTILKAMNRRYTTDEFSEYILQATQKVDNICIGTDVIVGFPGETDDHFNESVELLTKLPITYFHVFSYSDRKNNKSRLFPDKVDKATIEKRSLILRKLSQKKRKNYLEKQLGRTEKVLFEQLKNGYWSGLTDTFIRVLVKSELNLANQYVPVKLSHINNQAIIGTLS